MARRGNSKTGHVVRALTDGAYCKLGCILVVTGKEACVRHCGVDLEHQPVVGAQPPRMIEIGKRSDCVSLPDTKPPSNVPGGREMRIEGNRLFNQRGAAADILTQR